MYERIQYYIIYINYDITFIGRYYIKRFLKDPCVIDYSDMFSEQ